MTGFLVRAENAGRVFTQGAVEVKAVASATCAVRPGDRIALVGPSGSGKSTLLHLMGGLTAPTSGSVSWPGLGGPDSLRPHKISFVFQEPSLLPPLTVLENVSLPLLLKGENEAESRVTALNVLELLGLETLSEKLPEELSGGQSQRVAIARALACRPMLILADEPTGQLDRQTAQHLLDVVFALLKGSETAMVVATHDPEIASRMNEPWTMEHGVLEVCHHD